MDKAWYIPGKAKTGEAVGMKYDIAALKAKYNRAVDGEHYNEIVGKLWWDNPDVLWLAATDNAENYEGSQSQIGIRGDGELVWEYQSHCSCNSYGDQPSKVSASFLIQEDTGLELYPFALARWIAIRRIEKI